MGFGLGRPELVVPRFAVYVEPCELRRAKRVAKEEVFIALEIAVKSAAEVLAMSTLNPVNASHQLFASLLTRSHLFDDALPPFHVGGDRECVPALDVA